MARTKSGSEMEQKIIQAAGELFATLGYERTTISMIASKVGISNGHLNAYFPKKRDLNRRCFLNYFIKLTDRLGENTYFSDDPICYFFFAKITANFNVFCNPCMKDYREQLLNSSEMQQTFFENYYELLRDALEDSGIVLKDYRIREAQSMGLAAEYARIHCIGSTLTLEDFLSCEKSCAMITFSHLGINYEDAFNKVLEKVSQIDMLKLMDSIMDPYLKPSSYQ